MAHVGEDGVGELGEGDYSRLLFISSATIVLMVIALLLL